MDSLNLHIEVKSLKGRALPITKSIRNVRVLGTVDYSLKSMLQMEMTSLFDISIDTPTGASSIQTNGELQLVQAVPTHIDSVKRTLYQTSPFAIYDQYSLPDILEFYFDRQGNTSYPNITIERTIFHQKSLLVQPYGPVNKLTLDISIKIPATQRIRYTPGILETLKYAWIQYLAIFLPALFVFKEFIGFLFKYKILQANVVADLSNKKII